MNELTLPAGMMLRQVTPEDREQLLAWIAADPDHRELTTPEFFGAYTANKHGQMPTNPGEECYVLTDPDGDVFYLKLTRAVRIDIQFAPGCQDERKLRERTRFGLIEGFAWLERRLAGLAFRQVFFNSTNPQLVQSMQRRLGFARSPNELVRAIGPQEGR